ncbi:MAG: AAA family ATPase [Clostridiales bacterium]|nr:AAA family ATPase [Clostridiales bacterium]
MEIILLIGIPASGKSTFCMQSFYDTHIRINLDMLGARSKENVFIEACLDARQSFVVDNINITLESREKYIDIAKQLDIPIIAYFFETNLQDAIERNEGRSGKERIPIVAITAANKWLIAPSYTEGFDKLFRVKAQANFTFLVEEIPRQHN